MTEYSDKTSKTNNSRNESTKDIVNDVFLYRAAAQEKVRRAIYAKTKGDETEGKRLYTLLRQGDWTADPFLHRQMRKHFKHGHSKYRTKAPANGVVTVGPSPSLLREEVSQGSSRRTDPDGGKPVRANLALVVIMTGVLITAVDNGAKAPHGGIV